MQRWMKRGALVTVLALVGCGSGPGASGGQVQAVLMGKFKSAGKRHQRNEPVALLNITGQADSLLLLTPENGCGFSAWSANGQSGPIGVEGRTGESFDLAHPLGWTSRGTGLRTGCSGGRLDSAEAYFYHLDFHLAVHSTGVEDTVVRIFTSESGGAKFGDVQVRDADGTFKWVDLANDALVAVRPAVPARYVMNGPTGPLTVPWFDDNGTRKMMVTKLPLVLDVASVGKEVGPLTRKVVFDADFGAAGISVVDKATPGSVARTLSVPFLTNLQGMGGARVQVSVTPLTEAQVNGPDDPAPGDGNGQIIPTRDDGGVPDGGFLPDGGVYDGGR